MPIYPELQEQDSSQPLDLSKVTFPLTEQFTSAASNAYWKYQTNQFIGNIENLTEHTNDPAFEPMTAGDLDALKVDRPELKIPAGTSKFVASMMASMYDNDKHLGLVAQSNSKNMGKIGAFGAAIAGMAGSMAGALANPKAAIYGLAAAPAGRLIGATIAEKAIGSLGARELYGSASARIGTLLAEKSGEGALASMGFELENQRVEQQKRTVLEEPHEYLQSLQNIGEAGLFGAAFGLGLGTIGIGLRGRPVMRLADGTFIDKPPTGKAGVDENGQPWIAGQEGGLLNRPEFRNMGDTAKDYISRIYKPWSKDADITMREEATGQMYNGQEVNIDPVLKQGIADGGAEFRNGIKNFNDDPSNQVIEAPIKSEIELHEEKPVRSFDNKYDIIGVSLRSKFGSMELRNDSDGVTVRGIRLFSSTGKGENKNKGYGKELYREAIKYAESKGKKFLSDQQISPEAMRVYEALEKEGYVFKKNETTYLKSATKDKAGRTIKEHYTVTNAKPIFELVSSPRKSLPTRARSAAIDIEAFDRQLAEAQENIVSEMFVKHFSEEEPVTVPEEFKRLSTEDNFMKKDFYHGTGKLSDITEFDKKRATQDSLYGAALYITDNKLIAREYANLRKNQGIGNVLQVNFREQPKLIDVEKSPHKSIFETIRKSAKDKGDIKIDKKLSSKSIDDIFSAIKKQLREKYKSGKAPTTDKYGFTKDAFNDFLDFIHDLNDSLSKMGYDGYLHTGGRIMGKGNRHNVTALFNDRLLNKRLVTSLTEKERAEQRLADLHSQYMIAQSMRDHLTDTNEPLSDSEVKDYSEHLKTPGMRDNGYTTDVPREMEGFTTDDYLAEFPDKEINKTLETIGEKSDIAKEINITREKLKQQPTFEKMVTELSDCILKGGL